MKHLVLVTGLALSIAAPASAVGVNWVDWTSNSGATVAGTISAGGETIDVRYSNSANSISFAQLTGGIDYWQNGRSGRDPSTSPYTSIGPVGNDNIPTGTDIIAMGAQATHTLIFSKPIADLYFSYVSINGNTLSFSRDTAQTDPVAVQVLSNSGSNVDGNGTDASGYWGSNTVTQPDAFSFGSIGEAHGTAFLQGPFTMLSFTTSRSEGWHGFTIGTTGSVPPIPLPAAGWLMLAGIGALGVVRRRRQRG